MTESSIPVLALDGPSGSGKGTVGQLLAQRLGWHFLDSGALYRIIGLLAQQQGVVLDDAPGLVRLAATLEIAFLPQDGAETIVMANGQAVQDALRTEVVAAAASKVAVVPALRQALLQTQRDCRRPPGLVADGRDMGTTVFPDATFKVFLAASPEIRAERRYKQLKEKGFDGSLARLLKEIQERDARDATRTVSPLRPADDAYELDTSSTRIPEVVDHVYAKLQERLALQGQ